MASHNEQNPVATRIQSEKRFYNQFYAEGWEKEDERITEDIVPPNMMKYWGLIKSHIHHLHNDNRQPLVLDCGCGHGVASVLLGKIDARVVAVDISHNSTRITRKFAAVNQVDSKIHVVVAALEALPFKNDVFDSIVGSRVLHHVDVFESGRELARVEKSGAAAFFWECTEKNPVLRFARNHIRRIIPAPKFGTDHEHPLTTQELAALETTFGSPATVVWAPFYFFSLISQYLPGKQKMRLTDLGKLLDSIIGRAVPVLNRFSFHQILVFKKTPTETHK